MRAPVPGVLQAAQQLVEQDHLAAGDHQAGGHILVSGTRLEAVLLLRVVWGKEAKMNGRQANVAAEKERQGAWLQCLLAAAAWRGWESVLLAASMKLQRLLQSLD